ncbi:MAG TPA: 1,4-alpha-glucan branching protein domain-containing protein, partial [Planctomycetota bacterium]|nr:1,4-alpha-glucan branching protein domain-containing protein [Planctomycetota bacterium]
QEPAFETEMDLWLVARRETLEVDARDASIAAVARWWLRWCDDRARERESIGGLVKAFRRFEERGRLELGTSAATHAYLPLLSRDAFVSLQVQAAVAAHRRNFGRSPRGFWLPNAAYRPRYEWVPPIGRANGLGRSLRLGLEEVLAANGLEWFVVDAHLAGAGEPLSIYRSRFAALAALRGFEERFPQVAPARTPYETVRVRSRGAEASAVALLRDPRTALQVWSRDEAYPGDPLYLDFNRRKIANGPRYWRNATAGATEPYDPEAALARVEEHARHFVWLAADTLSRSGEGVLCAPFDAELFGHVWFEGPVWIEHVLRHLAAAGTPAIAASEALTAAPPRETVSLLEGSWGEGGDHRAWLNRDTEWTWDRLYDAEGDLASTLSGMPAGGPTDAPVARAARQAVRELLLLQASDWQFLITAGVARDYAERRFATHYVEMKRLVELVRRFHGGNAPTEEEALYLSVMERRDRLFPELDLAIGGAR